MRWIYGLAAAVALAAAVTAVVAIHEHPTWGQPIESGAAVAAALLTAVTAVAAAASAASSSNASQQAARSLALHDRPRVDITVSPVEGQAQLYVNCPSGARVRAWWVDASKAEHKAAWSGAGGVPLLGITGPGCSGHLLEVTFTEAGRVWRWQRGASTPTSAVDLAGDWLGPELELLRPAP